MENDNLIVKAKKCKDVDELKKVAKEEGLNLSDKEAKDYYDYFHVTNQQLSDAELNSVAGGCAPKRNGRHYASWGKHYLITTLGNCCSLYVSGSAHSGLERTCMKCTHCEAFNEGGPFTVYCTARTFDNDPLNPKK